VRERLGTVSCHVPRELAPAVVTFIEEESP
jgi:hypothetical protein